MRGHFTIQQQLDLGNGAACTVTDTSEPMEIDPVTEGPAILAQEQGLTEIVQIETGDVRLSWTAKTETGQTAVVTWGAA